MSSYTVNVETIETIEEIINKYAFAIHEYYIRGDWKKNL